MQVWKSGQSTSDMQLGMVPPGGTHEPCVHVSAPTQSGISLSAGQARNTPASVLLSGPVHGVKHLGLAGGAPSQMPAHIWWLLHPTPPLQPPLSVQPHASEPN